ncbi:MAG: hydrogenase maturation nickel metallochaperone HypA [Lachnospiraceae bacterium]|jgi:hydrogenase nickel incorporation protein HypA/HybF|nr:hydrogenase maturation nickel metallochaperone HypA [Lachnospiraceae bacterium]
MHELPIVTGLIETLEDEARRRGLKKIMEVDISIGELSDVVDECVRLYFETASEGTVTEGAVLHFTKQPAMLRCEKCGFVFPHAGSFSCPQCGGNGILVRGTGTDCVIERYSAV